MPNNDKKTIFNKLESLNQQLNLTHYWIVLLKFKRLIFIIPILMAILGYLVALNISPTFQSTATLVIEQENKKIVDIDEVYSSSEGGRFGNFNHVNNQVQIMKSDEVLNIALTNEQTVKKVRNLYNYL